MAKHHTYAHKTKQEDETDERSAGQVLRALRVCASRGAHHT
jgi:hypothetical protein